MFPWFLPGCFNLHVVVFVDREKKKKIAYNCMMYNIVFVDTSMLYLSIIWQNNFKEGITWNAVFRHLLKSRLTKIIEK